MPEPPAEPWELELMRKWQIKDVASLRDLLRQPPSAKYSRRRVPELWGDFETGVEQTVSTCSPTPGVAAQPRVQFQVQLSEFSKAIRCLRPARARARKAIADFVDFNAYTSKVEIVAPGVSVRFDARILRSGYARIPYLTFEWFGNALKTYRQPSAEVSFSEGQVRVANLKFKHPDISVRLIGSRIADLPIDAPLPDVLALLTRFTTEELSESGLLARVLAAQEDATKLIDRAMKALAPLEIKREELSEFITDVVRKRAQPG